VGTAQGVVLWELARGTELTFLPVGLAWHSMFEPSGDLLTNGSVGVWRWPIRLEVGRSELHIGPPRRVDLPGSTCSIAEDHSGRVVALADHGVAHILTPDRVYRLEHLDDCRYIAVSPDGQWMATGSHYRGALVWRIRDGSKVAELPIDEGTTVAFSPDGKWLMTSASCRLWEVGTWREAQQIGGWRMGFSPDGRLLAVQDASKLIRLVETQTGHTLARFESPELYAAGSATFTPDGSCLLLTTRDGPAIRVWDLRAIRKYLARVRLDWDAPAYPEEDPADPGVAALPEPVVD
jgi:WD40 repeat protein